MGETSPDSVFASLLLRHHQNSSMTSPGHHHHPPTFDNHHHHHQKNITTQHPPSQPQATSSSSTSYDNDPPFTNLPSQRSISAPLESNGRTLDNYYADSTAASSTSTSFQHTTSRSFLWEGGGGGGSLLLGQERDVLDHVTSQVYDLSLGTTADTSSNSMSANHHHHSHPPRLHRSTSAFGSDAEMIHHPPVHQRSGLSFFEEERGATAPPSSRPNEDVLWSSSSLLGARNSHWMMEQSSGTRAAMTGLSNPSPLAPVRPAAKTLMELIQEQDTMQSFIAMNQQVQQQQQQVNTPSANTTTTTTTTASRLMGPPGYPVQPEQRWVLESNTTPPQQQQILQQQQRTNTMTATMYQLQPRPQQVLLGNPTGDFRYAVPATSYNNTTTTISPNPSTYHTNATTMTNNHHATSYVSVMPILQQQQQPPPSQANVYWQQQPPQPQQLPDHQMSPSSPHYGRSRGPHQPQRRRPSHPRSSRSNHSHHHFNEYNSSCTPTKQHHLHHNFIHQPSISPPRNTTTTTHHIGSSLLEEFRTSKRSDWTISLIVGHIVEFCQDQNGSRFIQQRLEIGDSLDLVLNEVLPSMHILRIDVFGNYVVQKLLDFGSPDMKMEIRNTLEGEMVSLSLQMYGCRVVQKAIETLPEDQLFTLLNEFHHNVLSLIHDQNGNHVIQKCVEVLNSRAHAALHNGDNTRAEFLWNQVDFIIQDVLINTKSLSCHPYGCRVFQRMLEHCCEERKLELLDKIAKAHSSLLDDQYGNYVIQHVLQYGRDDDRNSILSIIQENGLLGLSRQKFASNVVEKLLKYGNSHHRRAVIREMLKKTEDPALHAQLKRVSIVLLMVRDAYANYVVQTTLDVAPESPERRALLYELNSHVDELRNYTFAKHIVAKLTSSTAAAASSSSR